MNDNLTIDTRALNFALKKLGIKSPYESHRLGEVYLMLSLDCNLKCKACSWWGKKGPCNDRDFLKKYRPSLTLKELERFADQIIAFRPRQVSFSGGEPLMYDKWYPLAKYLHKKKVKVSLVTNGVFLAENFTKVKDVVDEVNVSMEGQPSIFSLATKGSKADFNAIIEGLKKISDFKKKNNNKPALSILFTISDVSYKHMDELIDFMDKRGIKIDRYNFQHLIFNGPRTHRAQKEIFKKEFGIGKLDLWKGYTYFPARMDFSKFKREIEKVKRRPNVHFSADLHPQELEPYYRDQREAIHYANYCTAPWHQLNLMPNGELFTCPGYFIGNIRGDKSLAQIWNGPKARKLRQYLSKKLFPGCKGCFYYYCDRVK